VPPSRTASAPTMMSTRSCRQTMSRTE
jgi:hypothetical protein